MMGCLVPAVWGRCVWPIRLVRGILAHPAAERTISVSTRAEEQGTLGGTRSYEPIYLYHEYRPARRRPPLLHIGSKYVRQIHTVKPIAKYTHWTFDIIEGILKTVWGTRSPNLDRMFIVHRKERSTLVQRRIRHKEITLLRYLR
jgi:hypothetical protein